MEVLLRQEDIRFNERNRLGGTPLYIAAQNGHAKVVELLLKMDGIEVSYQMRIINFGIWHILYTEISFILRSRFGEVCSCCS